MCLFTSQAFASDGYQAGYDAGYYTGALPEHGDDYGRGVDDGSYDAYQEDMARSSYTVGEDSITRQTEMLRSIYGLDKNENH